MMSIFELLGVLGLAVVAAYAVVWSTELNWHRGLVRVVGGPSHSVSKSGFEDAYVSETTPAYFQYVRRRYRYEVHCPVRYGVNGQIGEGLVIDMTREGWRVRGQGGMRLGMVLSLDLMPPDASGAISISRAVVCWVQGTDFGVKLESMDSQSAAQLSEYFSTLPRTAAVAPQAA
ncbi:MAG: PilZ domain-containing protein [Nitrospira sp.]